ncbi:MAG: phosphoribosyltransferase family protein [Planctomycetota bacterium]
MHSLLHRTFTTTVAASRWAWRESVHFAYPQTCVHCEAGAEGMFCEACEAGWSATLAEPCCFACGRPVADAEAPCTWCGGNGRRRLDRVARLGVLNGPLQSAVIAQKYKSQWWIAERLADTLADRPMARSVLADAHVIVAVPLHWSRRVSRGYNQAAVIADMLGKRRGVPVVRPAVRHRRTLPQVRTKSMRERWENVRDAFRLTNPDAVAGKRVVIVDDVMTTGSTIGALARAIDPAGPEAISAVVLAVADPKHSDFERK